MGLEATVPLDVGRVPSAFAGLTVPGYGWAVLSVAGGLATAVFGWVVVTGLTVLGWLSAQGSSFRAALGVGTELWLLSTGAGGRVGGVSLSLVPLGVTAVWALMLARFARVAARHAGSGLSDRAVTWRVSAVLTGTYVATVVLVAAAAQAAAGGLDVDPARLPHAFAFSVGVAGPVTWWAAARQRGHRPSQRWPVWARGVPTAVAGASAVLLLGGTVAVTASLLAHLDRVGALWSALDAGPVGGVVLLVLQLALVPNAVVWGTVYTLGSGFGVGAGTLVAPRATDLGLLPGLPVFGALPAEGAGSPLQVGWLAVGVLAGVVAALVVLRAGTTGRSAPTRVDEAALVGGLAGAVAGLVVALLAWFTTGGLGTGRLAHLGPHLPTTLVVAPLTLGLSGMVTGLVAVAVGALVARFRRS